jgi:hypothetical protein
VVGCGPFGTNSLRQTPVENIKEQEKMWNLGQKTLLLFSLFSPSRSRSHPLPHWGIARIPRLISPPPSLSSSSSFSLRDFFFSLFFYFSREREWGRRGDQQLFISGVWRYLFISAPFVVSCLFFFGRNFEFPARVKFKFPKRPSTTRRVEKEKKEKRRKKSNWLGPAGPVTSRQT